MAKRQADEEQRVLCSTGNRSAFGRLGRGHCSRALGATGTARGAQPRSPPPAPTTTRPAVGFIAGRRCPIGKEDPCVLWTLSGQRCWVLNLRTNEQKNRQSDGTG